MIQFTTTILQFGEQGEKTGWTYINIPSEMAEKLKPRTKKSFRVKGKLDDYPIRGVALIPMGGGDFIIAINAEMRKGIKKRRGATLKVTLSADDQFVIEPPADLIECLTDEPGSIDFFNSLAKSHRDYFVKWLNSAKTDQTRTKRIAMIVNAMAKKQDYGTMIRNSRKDNII
jgi:hypothetical protein